MAVEPLSEPVCVVIADEDISQDEARDCLGDSLPVRVVFWQDPSYVATITALRPQVIVVLAEWGTPDALVRERCQLIASLFSSFAPTVISATMSSLPIGAPCLVVQQLGTGATVKIGGLSALRLP